MVITSYNHAQFLETRIRSILNQSYQNFELLILDDCSTDNSHNVILQFPWDREYQYIRNEKNSGSPFLQWQRGALTCQSDYLWIAESDDSSDPNFLERTLEQIQSDDQISMAYCQSLGIDANGAETWKYIDWTNDLDPERWTSSFVVDGKEFVRNYLLRKCAIPNVSSVLFRTSALRSCRFPDPWIRHYGDWLIYAQVAWQGKVGFVDAELNLFRGHAQTQRARSSINHFKEYRHVVHQLGRTYAGHLTAQEKQDLRAHHIQQMLKSGHSSNLIRRYQNRLKARLSLLPYCL